MFKIIAIAGKEVEAFISDSSPEADKITLYFTKNKFCSREEIGVIRLYNNNEIYLNRAGEDLFGYKAKPVLSAEALQTVLDSQAKAISAKRGTYVESRAERAEWNDDQHGHLLLKGRY